tara:strand:+ start:16670 stop:16834 length:165 start_codon:yes stop_codon:yes gene_type:complete
MNKQTSSNRNSFGKFPLVACASLLFVFLLSGCNTVEGIGEDVEEAGERIENAAN